MSILTPEERSQAQSEEARKTARASSLICEFFVGGLVRPQPRASPGRGGHVISATAAHGVREWRAKIHAQAQLSMMGKTPFVGAVRLVACFIFPRPKALIKKLGWAPCLHTNTPDSKNLLTALEDALSMLVWIDDRQNSTIVIRKRYAVENEAPGVVVRAYPDAIPWE